MFLEGFKARQILGIEITVCRKQDAMTLLLDHLAKWVPTSVGFANAHFLTQLSTNPNRAALLQDMVIFNDGLGADIASLILYGERFSDNLNGTDFIPEFLAALPKGTREFLYGSHRDIVGRAATIIAEQYPIIMCGHHDGYANKEEKVVREINARKADVVLIALGNPLQEAWIASHRSRISAPLLVGVGAMFDFVAGAVPRAPLWVRRLRIEWLFRFLQEPRRLGKRYTIEIIRFLAMVFAQRIGWRCAL